MGGANSQVLLNETEMEAAAQGLRNLLSRFQVRRNRCCLSGRRVPDVPAVTCVQALALARRRVLNRFSFLLAGARFFFEFRNPTAKGEKETSPSPGVHGNEASPHVRGGE